MFCNKDKAQQHFPKPSNSKTCTSMRCPAQVDDLTGNTLGQPPALLPHCHPPARAVMPCTEQPRDRSTTLSPAAGRCGSAQCCSVLAAALSIAQASRACPVLQVLLLRPTWAAAPRERAVPETRGASRQLCTLLYQAGARTPCTGTASSQGGETQS